jgi:hypothetical protein
MPLLMPGESRSIPNGPAHVDEVGSGLLAAVDLAVAVNLDVVGTEAVDFGTASTARRHRSTATSLLPGAGLVACHGPTDYHDEVGLGLLVTRVDVIAVDVKVVRAVLKAHETSGALTAAHEELDVVADVAVDGAGILGLTDTVQVLKTDLSKALPQTVDTYRGASGRFSTATFQTHTLEPSVARVVRGGQVGEDNLIFAIRLRGDLKGDAARHANTMKVFLVAGPGWIWRAYAKK